MALIQTNMPHVYQFCASGSEGSTYIVKLLSAVDLVLVDERQHDPVTDDRALTEDVGNERSKACIWVHNAFAKVKVNTYYSHWGHGCDRIDDGWDQAKFSCLKKKKKPI